MGTPNISIGIAFAPTTGIERFLGGDLLTKAAYRGMIVKKGVNATELSLLHHFQRP